MRSIRPFLGVFFLASAVACRKSEPPAPATTSLPQAVAPAVPPAATGMMAPGHAPVAAAAPVLASLSGTVVETMDSGGYTYMKLKMADGSEDWAAVNKAPVKKGQKVTVVNAMPMDGFESKTLKRKFDKIVFGQLEGQTAAAPMSANAAPAADPMGGGGPPADVKAQMAAQHAGISQPADIGKIDVPKAEGKDARRVAEVFAEKAQLDGKLVTIRGKVVKFTPGVMGRNWIHLRDGSGTNEKKDNDITVTTKDAAAIGDTVVAKGKVGVGRDFGMGYSYSVLIEEATVTK